MSAKYPLFIDVVGICSAATWMVGREVQVVKVLGCCNDGMEAIVMGEFRGLELTLYQATGDRDRMVWLQV